MGEIIPFPVSATCFEILGSNEHHVPKEGLWTKVLFKTFHFLFQKYFLKLAPTGPIISENQTDWEKN